jgi:predicted transcriptional regulator
VVTDEELAEVHRDSSIHKRRALARLAAQTGRTVDEVAVDLLVSSMDHDEWFRTEVERGRVAAHEGRLLEHDDVVTRMDRRYRG